MAESGKKLQFFIGETAEKVWVFLGSEAFFCRTDEKIVQTNLNFVIQNLEASVLGLCRAKKWPPIRNPAKT